MQKRILFFLTLGVLLTACSTVFSTPTPEPTPVALSTPTPTLEPEPTESPTPVFSSDPFNEGIVARRNGNYARAIAAFQLVLKSNPAPDLREEAQYRLAEAIWLNSDDVRAITELTAFLQTYPKGARVPEARYLLADAYRAKKDYANALEQFRIYRGLSPALVGDTDAAIADVLVLAGDALNAIAQYERALQDPTLANSARVNILMRTADVHLGRNEQALAAARYDAALNYAGDARTKADLLFRAGDAYAVAKQTDKALARWNDAVNKYPDQAGAYKALVALVNRSAPVDEFQRGLIDYYAAAYDAAIAAFQRHLQNSSARAGDARYYIASARARQGAYSQAIADYDTLIKSLPKDNRVPDAYLGKASAYAAIGKFDEAVAVYKKLASALPGNALADDALWRAAQLLDRARRYGEAAALYEEAQKKYPASSWADDALFWAGMDYYRGKDFKTAMARWQAITKDYTQSTYYARALFWLGKAAQARGLSADAKNYWTQAAALNAGYYSFRAKDSLTPTKNNVAYEFARFAMDTPADRAEFEKWLGAWSKAPANGTLDAVTRNDMRFKRGAELLRLDRTVEARREFAALIEDKKEDERTLYALALYLRDNNQYSLAIDCAEKIAQQANAAGAPSAPRMLWLLRYPTYYADLVVAEAKTNNVDPLLYFALIRQESSFNPWVTSSADARGLGQIMPATGRDIAKRLNVKNFAIDQLYLPYISVRFGVWYFAQEMRTWDEPVWALAAYNAGGGRVKNWIKPDLDFAIEDIDISETALYVRVVYSNWKQYQAVYAVK